MTEDQYGELQEQLEDAYQAAVIGEAIDIDYNDPHGALAHVLQKALAASVIALHGLVKCDPTDAAKIMRLQSIARRYQDLVNWIGQLDGEADQATDLLRQELEDEDVDLSPPGMERQPSAEDEPNDA